MAGTFDTLQSLTSDIKELFGNWNDRLRETCEMTSPTGKKFSTLWAGSVRRFSKKLGKFDFPKVQGSYIQDLDVSGDEYPMTVFFEGKDHDKTARSFFETCKENGRWTVNHPVHGKKTLQLSSCEENDDPIGNGNITAFTLEFLESIDLPTPGASLAPQIKEQSLLTNVANSIQAVNNIVTDTFSKIQKVIDFANTAQIIIGAALEPLKMLNTEINNTFNEIMSSIDNTLQAAVFDPLVIVGEFQQLIQLPALATTDIQLRLNSYKNISNEILNNKAISFSSPEDKNTVSTQESILISTLTACCISAIDADVKSRPQAVEAKENIYNMFVDITNYLDNAQTLFLNNSIETQYFSQSSAFSEISKLVGLALDHLNSLIFNLAVEKRFTLTDWRTPWDIAVSEYGDPGENDSNIDLFIESNDLHGNDILILSPGRQVIIYAQ